MNEQHSTSSGGEPAQTWAGRVGTQMREWRSALASILTRSAPQSANSGDASRPARVGSISRHAATALFAMAASFGASAQTSQLSFLYDSFSGAGSQLSFNGNAQINGTELRLTQAAGGQAGSAFNTERVQFSTNYSFSSYFTFRMLDQDGGGADGLTFTIQTSSNSSLSAGGGLGYSGIPNSLAVEFDTYQNGALETNSHVAIDINGDVSHSVYTVGNGYYADTTAFTADFADGAVYHVWVDYNGATQTLQLRLAKNSDDRSTSSLILDKSGIDLAAILGVNQAYVGFTAATGGGWESHDVLQWYFVNRYDPIDTSGPTIYVPASTNANLSSLAVSDGSLSPAFDSGTTAYSVSVPYLTSSLTFTPTVQDPTATVTVSDVAVTSGTPSGSVALGVGSNAVTVRGIAQNGSTKTYSVTVNRAAAQLATLSTTAASAVTGSGAESGGDITSDGGAPISARGLAYGTSPAPSIAGSTVGAGSGSGSFVASLSGLSQATTYYVRAFATNDAGTAYGNQISFTTLVPPSAPAAPGIVGRASGSISINWIAPDPGSSAITGYIVERSLQAPINWEAAGGTCAAPGTSTACTASTLAPGQNYVFRVAAVSAVGPGGFSPASPSEIAATLPDAPAAPTVVLGDSGELVVNWAYPADDGGSGVIEYSVIQTPPGSELCQPDGTPPVTTCTATGLNNGTLYTFTVAARNVPGWGDGSAPSIPQAPATVPDAPTDLNGVAGNSAVSMSWSAPLEDGGAPILGYVVTASPNGNTCLASAPSTSCTVSGLSNDTPYTFVVQANNVQGSSDPSAAAGPYTPLRSPSSTVITGTTASQNAGTRARTNETFTVNFEVSSADIQGQLEGGLVTVQALTAADVPVGASCSAMIGSPGRGSNQPAGTPPPESGSCQLSGLKPSDGVARLVATFGGNPRVDPSSSSPFGFTVSPSNTTSDLTTAATVFGQDIVLNATFAAVAPGAGPVTGTARFVRQPGNVTIVEVPVAAGAASTTISTSPAVGNITYNVALLSNTDFNGSNDSVSHTVSKANTSTTVLSVVPADAGDGIQVLENVAVTASVTAVAPGAGAPSGTVTVRRIDAPLRASNAAAGVPSNEECSFSVPAESSCVLQFVSKGEAVAVEADYSGDSSFNGSTGVSALFDVLGLATTLSLSPPIEDPYYGNSFSVGYSLSGGDGQFDGALNLMATGAITIHAPGGIPAVCTSTNPPSNSSGVCSFDAALPIDAGLYTLEGNYAGDPTDLADDATASLNIQQATTELAVVTTPGSSEAGQSVSFAVELLLTNGTGLLNGNIAISADGLSDAGDPSPGCTLPVVDGASPFTASCSRAFTLFGDDQTVTAVFTPATSNFAGDSATTTHDVTSALTSVVIGTISPVAAQVGDAVTVPFDVNGGVGSFEGAVTVNVNAMPVSCSGFAFDASSGEGSCTVPAEFFQAPGTYTATVAFDGVALGNDADSSADAEISIAKRAVSTTLSTAINPEQAGVSASFAVSTSAVGGGVYDVGNSASGVAYVCLASGACDSGTALCTASLSGGGTDGAASGSCAITFSTVESRDLVAVYAGNDNFESDSSNTLGFATTPRETSLAISSLSPATTLVGQQLTVNFTVSGGTGEITGTVDIVATGPGAITESCVGASVSPTIGTATGSCTFRVADGNGLEQAGAWSFAAEFVPGVDSNDAASSTGPAAASRTVTQASTGLVLSSSPYPSVYNQPFTLTATVTAQAPAEGYPTGDVNFQDGDSNAIGVVTLQPTATPGVSTASVSGLIRPAGTFRFVAATITNPNFVGANDFGYDHLVDRADQTISFADPADVDFAEGGTFVVSATADSGLAVSFDSSTPSVCSVMAPGTSPATINILSGGVCTLTASQGGDSNWNAAVSVPQSLTINAIAQTISFAALPNRAAAAGDFNVSASASSNLLVSFASTTEGVCTLSGNTVSYVSAGECSITATQAGTSSYSAAEPVTQSFYYVALSLSPESLPDGNRGTAYSAQFSATGAGSVAPYVYTVSAGTLPTGVSLVGDSLSGTPSAAGSFNFTVRVTDSSMAPNVDAPYFAERAYTVEIAKNLQTISFGAAPSLVYDGPDGTLSATGGDSGEPVVFSALTPTVCSVTGDQVTPLLAGTCTVAANQAGNDDYEAADQVTQEIVVAQAAQAALTAIATPTSVAYLDTSALSTSGGSTAGSVSYAVSSGGSFCEISGSTLTAIAAGGSCTVTATMAGDANYLPVSADVVVNTIKAEQAALTAIATPSSIAFDADSALSTSGGSGTGAVSYAVTTGGANCSIAASTLTGIGIGTCTVTATQAGDANYEAATATVEVTVTQAAQTISFGANPGPLSVSGPSGSVSASASSGLAVSYASSTPSVCTVDSGSGALTIVTAGDCVITADQAGDVNYQAAPQASQTVEIAPAQPSISLIGSGSPTSPGEAVTFTATVTGGFSPTGTVSFRNGGVDIASCVNLALDGSLQAECVTDTLPQGSHPITARYNGDVNNLFALSTELTQVVLTGSTISLNGSNLTQARFGQVVSVGYTVSGGVAPNAGLVTVTASRPGSTVTCSAAASAGACSLTGLVTTGALPLDGYTVSASYAGDADDGAASTAASQTLTVVRSNTNTALSISPVNSAPFGQSFVLTATLTAVAPGGGVPTGTVVFLRDGESIAEVALNGAGVASFTVPAGLAVGSYVFRAEYAQTLNYLQSFDSRSYAVVNKASATTITGSSVTPSELGASVAFSYSVVGVPSDTTPTGNVSLTASTGESCTATVAAGTCSISFATAGNRTVTAEYEGDSVHGSSSSAAFAHAVNKGSQAALTAVASPDAIVFNATSALSTTGGSGDGAVSYAVTAGAGFCSISGSTLTATGVGSCTVTATKAADANYLAATADVVVTVSPAAQAALIAIASPDAIVFGGSSTLSTTGGSGTGAVSYAVTDGASFCSISDSTLSAIGVGSCTVTATRAADANYLAASATVVVTVSQAEQAALVVTATPQTIEFGGSSTLSTSGGSGTGAVSYTITDGASFCSISDSSLTAIGVGSCTVSATKAADANYLEASAAVVVTVNPAPQETLVAIATPAAIVFGGSSTLSTTGGSGDGLVSYIVTDGASFCSISGTTLTATGVGNCTVTATKAADANYAVATATVVVTVEKAEQAVLTAIATPAAIVFNGSSTLSTTGGSGTGEVSYAVTDGAGFCSITGSSLTATGVGNCTVTATKAADANYLAATATVLVSVSAAEQATLVAVATPTSIAFGATSELSTTGGSGTGAVSYAVTAGAGACSITGSTLTATAVGSCTVTATKAADANYLAATADVVVNVGLAQQATLTAIATPDAIVFGGSSTLSTTGGSGDGAVSYAVTAGAGVCAITDSTLTATGVGNCTVTATKGADANYAAATATVVVTVSRATQAALVVSASPDTIVYLGTSTLAASGGTGEGAISFAVTGGTGSCSIVGSTLTGNGVGTCTVTATKSGGANYEDQTGTVTVTVNPATQAVLTAIATPSSVIAGATSALSTSGGSGTGAVSYAVTTGAGFCSVSGSTLTGTAVGICTVTATKAADANYLAATASVDVTVLAADVDLSIVKSGRYIVGNGIVWTLQVGNAGPGAVTAARVIDTLPSSVSGATWTCTGTSGGSCTAASGSGDIDTTLTLPNGGGAVFEITATLVDPTAATVINTASVQAPMGITDTNPANNSSTLDLRVALFADGFEGPSNLFGSLKSAAQMQTMTLDGSQLEQAIRGINPQDAARFSGIGSDLLVQVREVNGLAEVRLLQREAEGLWTRTRWIELWPGDAVRVDYSKAGGSLETRLGVGPQ
jgi:hypothetical protein